MKKNKKRMLQNPLMKVLGVILVMSLVLTNSVTLIFADTPKVSKGDLFPKSLTVSSPRALSEIALPSNDYGSLSWKSPSTVASDSSGSYGVVFQADSDVKADFSQVDGWDAKRRTVSGSVTVYVKSGAQETEESSEASKSEPSESETSKQEGDADASVPEEDAETKEENEATDKSTEESPLEEGEAASKEESAEEETEEQKPQDSASGESKEEESLGEGTLGSLEGEPSDLPSSNESEESQEEQPQGSLEEEKGELPEEETEQPQEEHAGDHQETGEGTPQVEELPEGEAPEESLPETPMDLVEEEERPTEVSEDFTPEEQAAVAAENHTSQGITVSGHFLPWYVQFRVYDGSGFGFTNAADADSFQAYEFQLWDLLKDEEYQIPEGETVQVTMPVSSGYDYSIQHILPDGSVETITPSVFGNTMVFSASSFSPFGIAGSKPLVGGDIADSGYSEENVNSGQNTSSGSVSGSRPSGNSSSQTGGSSVSGSGSGGQQSSSSKNGSSGSGSSIRTSGTSEISATVGIQANTDRTSTNPVKTGDQTNVMPFVIIALGALLVIVALVLAIKNKRK